MALLNPAHNLLAVREIAAVLKERRHLILELTKRELTEKHAGQVLGAVWALGHPIILMAVYVFLFAVVFHTRIEARGLYLPPNADYTLYILSGLIPWMMFQESMSKGASVIVGNSNLVKQVVFPIEVLPIKAVLASALTLVLLLAMLLLYVLVRFHTLYWGLAVLPVLVVFQSLAMAGIAFGLSAVGCYLRDVRELVQIFGLVNIYLMPVVYLPAWVPHSFRPFLYANPFSHMIWCYQDALFYRQPEHPWAWLVFPALSVLVFVAGYRTFRKLKPFFGNVL